MPVPFTYSMLEAAAINVEPVPANTNGWRREPTAFTVTLLLLLFVKVLGPFADKVMVPMLTAPARAEW